MSCVVFVSTHSKTRITEWSANYNLTSKTHLGFEILQHVKSRWKLTIKIVTVLL